jgi:hypothetical protein
MGRAVACASCDEASGVSSQHSQIGAACTPGTAEQYSVMEEDGSPKQSPGLVTSLLFHLILESQGLDGSFLDKFWGNLGTCHPKLEENSMSILFLFILFIASIFTQSANSRLRRN